MLSEVLEREIAWHREMAKTLKLFKMPASEIEKYTKTPAASSNPKQYMFSHMNPIEGKVILDFGCGDGVTAIQLAMMGAKKVIGFDLSPDLIQYAIRLANMNDVGKKCEFYEAEATTFNLGIKIYDIILVDNVMHHLPREKFQGILKRINRSLKPDGKVIFREPINYLTWLNSFKRVIGYSADATEDEHELSYPDVMTIASSFDIVTEKYFSILDRVAMSTGLKKARFAAQRIDRALLGLMPALMKRFAGTVVITGYPCNK